MTQAKINKLQGQLASIPNQIRHLQKKLHDAPLSVQILLAVGMLLIFAILVWFMKLGYNTLVGMNAVPTLNENFQETKCPSGYETETNNIGRLGLCVNPSFGRNNANSCCSQCYEAGVGANGYCRCTLIVNGQVVYKDLVFDPETKKMVCPTQ